MADIVDSRDALKKRLANKIAGLRRVLRSSVFAAHRVDAEEKITCLTEVASWIGEWEDAEKAEFDAKPKCGWGWPGLAKKAHYFMNSNVCLCTAWMYSGPREVGNDGSPDNCKECRKRLAEYFAPAKT